jgi:DNA polymerase II large subunit
LNIKELLHNAIQKVGKPNPKFKGVKGLMSKDKTSEPLEKGILRSRHQVYIFKDGTIRMDSTNLPLTHFKPSEIKTSIPKLKELGYTTDKDGNELVNEDQVVELFPQDIVPSANISEYLLRATQFIDDLLTQFYGVEAFYNCKTPSDVIGQLVIGLAPHTSAGVVGRIIGFSQAHGCYQHPLWIACSRRDCDGDENAIMLLLDALTNFSVHYLPSSRGGKMDASLVLTLGLKPLEIDDQVHEMDICDHYPLEFYRTSHELKKPSNYYDMIESLSHRLNKDTQYDDWKYTMETTKIDDGVIQSSYTKLGAMTEKVGAQLGLGRKITAVDEKDEAARLLNSHFFRDIYGNLRAFGEQKFRCVECNAKYRRVPLVGKCTKCGGRLILTIAEGSVRKYLEISRSIARDYKLSSYIMQRLDIVGKNIDSVFVNDKSKQYSLADFI